VLRKGTGPLLEYNDLCLQVNPIVGHSYFLMCDCKREANHPLIKTPPSWFLPPDRHNITEILVKGGIKSSTIKIIKIYEGPVYKFIDNKILNTVQTILNKISIMMITQLEFKVLNISFETLCLKKNCQQLPIFSPTLTHEMYATV